MQNPKTTVILGVTHLTTCPILTKSKERILEKTRELVKGKKTSAPIYCDLCKPKGKK